MGTSYTVNLVGGGQATIVEKITEQPDRGIAGMVFIGDDGERYVTVGSDPQMLVLESEATQAVEFDPGTPEKPTEETEE